MTVSITGKQRTKFFGDTAVLVRLRGQQRTRQKLGADNRGKGDVGAWLARIPCEQHGIPTAQNLDTRVGVEQEPHGELPASRFLLGLIRDAVGKVRRCPEKTQHVGVGAADVTGVSGFHAQEKKEIQRFALHLFG
jgi:hypothetical protein